MALPLAIIPLKIIDQYQLDKIAHNGMIHIEIRKGMPGLKQAGKIAYDRVCTHQKNTDMPHYQVTHPFGVISHGKQFSP